MLLEKAVICLLVMILSVMCFYLQKCFENSVSKENTTEKSQILK